MVSSYVLPNRFDSARSIGETMIVTAVSVCISQSSGTTSAPLSRATRVCSRH